MDHGARVWVLGGPLSVPCGFTFSQAVERFTAERRRAVTCRGPCFPVLSRGLRPQRGNATKTCTSNWIERANLKLGTPCKLVWPNCFFDFVLCSAWELSLTVAPVTEVWHKPCNKKPTELTALGLVTSQVVPKAAKGLKRMGWICHGFSCWFPLEAFCGVCVCVRLK